MVSRNNRATEDENVRPSQTLFRIHRSDSTRIRFLFAMRSLDRFLFEMRTRSLDVPSSSRATHATHSPRYNYNTPSPYLASPRSPSTHPPYFFSSPASTIAFLNASNASLAATSTPSVSASLPNVFTSSCICILTRSSSVEPSSGGAAPPPPRVKKDRPCRPFLSQRRESSVFFCVERIVAYLLRVRKREQKHQLSQRETAERELQRLTSPQRPPRRPSPISSSARPR
jgi:hypothetical protein